MTPRASAPRVADAVPTATTSRRCALDALHGSVVNSKSSTATRFIVLGIDDSVWKRTECVRARMHASGMERKCGLLHGEDWTAREPLRTLSRPLGTTCPENA